jgi:hypothetical protein
MPGCSNSLVLLVLTVRNTARATAAWPMPRADLSCRSALASTELVGLTKTLGVLLLLLSKHGAKHPPRPWVISATLSICPGCKHSAS